MNYALIFAGGTGQRMRSKSIPKQFLSVHGKPIIIHTLSHFENCELIDGMAVVCYEPFITELNKLLKTFGIKKVTDVVAGGESGQQSIFRGLRSLAKRVKGDDIVLIHDGVRPLIDDGLLTDNINCVKKYGNAITVSKAIETVISADNGRVTDIADRSQCYYAKAPQSFLFKDIYECHKKAAAENDSGFIDSATMMRYYGYELHTVECSSNNIKITTQKDYFMFKGLLDAQELDQMNVEL